jgi:hypothetical protein
MADGTMHPHQRTASSRSLDELTTRLLEAETDIAGCTSFDELHSLVRRRTRSVRGIGELTVYDVALRTGMWPGLSLEPALVYLPFRASSSLRALGVEQTRGTAEMSAFPPEFAPLHPREVTDLLCAFRGVLPKQG